MTNLDTCVEEALAGLDTSMRTEFASAPLHTLTQRLGIKVRAVDHLQRRDDGGTCDGVSFLQDDVILYAATRNRRQNFTLAHELGHRLVVDNDNVLDWLADQDETAAVLETLCDRIAARLLVPGDVIDNVIGPGPLRAHHVTDLVTATNASLPVCVIALATRLPGVGAIVVTDRASKTVTYASVQPHPVQGWPVVHPWPNQPVPAGHPIQSLGPDATTTRKSFWATPWGTRADFYLDARADARRTIAILADTDLWNAEVFHPATTREFDQRPERELNCCGRTQNVRGYPCPTCDGPYCPECGLCPCQRRAKNETRCAGRCGLQYLPHLLEDGKCDDCR